MKFEGIAFAGLDHWWAVALIGAIGVVFALNFWLISHKLTKYGFTFGGNRFLKHFSSIRRIIKIVLFCVALVGIAIAFLQPRWGKKEELVEQEGRDLFILIDISRSMLAQDMKPNRLEFAKQKIKTLLSMIKTDRVGLVVFAGRPIVHCPLTQDVAAFNLFLDQIDSSVVGFGTTALDNALRIVLEQFDRLPGHKSKLAVLFTDGEDFSHNLSDVRTKATGQGLHIFALGVGTTQGVPIPEYDEQGRKKGFVKDEHGTVVISRLNESLLKSLARQVNGLYVSSSDDDSDIRLILSHVEQYEKEKFDHQRMSMLQEQYPCFIGISFMCLVLEWIL